MYPHKEILALRDEGLSWEEVAETMRDRHSNLVDTTPKQLRQAHNRWVKRNRHVPVSERSDDLEGQARTSYAELSDRVESIEDIKRVLRIDEKEWDVQSYPVKFYPIQRKGGQIIQGATIGAVLKPSRDARYEAARAAIKETLEAFKDHDPYYRPEVSKVVRDRSERTCEAFVNVYDAHLGMLAYGKETGSGDYDLATGARDYVAAGKHQIDVAMLHPIRAINIVIGHDLQHIDMIVQKSGVTAAGTPQDFDSRLPKIFTTAREVAIEVIDYALSKGLPVNVYMVPGNHDPQSTYRLGEVIFAWYRNVPRVTVHNGPRRHRWHLHGKNSVLMTHGERSMARQRPLMLSALAEQPDEHRLALTTHMLIFCGHLHTEKRGEYVPAGLVDSERNITIYNLKGLTEVDSWHELQDYGHVRGSDLLITHELGGVLAQHTYFPHIHGAPTDV